MKSFLLQTLLLIPLVGAIQHPFGLLDDLLASPQYSIVFTNSSFYKNEHGRIRRLDPTASKVIDGSHVAHLSDSDTSEDFSLAHPLRKPPLTPESEESVHHMADWEVMVRGNERYLCQIPNPPPKRAIPNVPLDPEMEKEELRRASAHGLELLKGMEDNCIYLLDVWWAYMFCFNHEVRQFRPLTPERGLPPYPPVADPAHDSFTLGRYAQPSKWKPNAKVVTSVKTKGGSRYLSQYLTDGTLCDLTGRERDVEVQFQCNSQASSDRIVMVKEVALCSYLMIIYTPRLCNDDAFLPPQDNNPNPIKCGPIYQGNDLQDEETQLHGSYQKFISSGKLAYEPHQVVGKSHLQGFETDMADVLNKMASESNIMEVGGIIIGGKKQVGMPGKAIEKSAIVGGKQEVTVVADSSGFILSLAELRKLQIASLREVETMKKSLESMASGREWRLELVQTPHRKEFRGVLIESDDAGTDKDNKTAAADSKAAPKGEEKTPTAGRGNPNQHSGGKERSKPDKNERNSKTTPGSDPNSDQPANALRDRDEL